MTVSNFDRKYKLHKVFYSTYSIFSIYFSYRKNLTVSILCFFYVSFLFMNLRPKSMSIEGFSVT